MVLATFLLDKATGWHLELKPLIRVMLGTLSNVLNCDPILGSNSLQ